jgi:osmotically-inducible protein OsmY
MRKLVLFFCWLSLLGLLIGCARKANDATIQKDIETKVSADPETQDSQVAIESKQGNVKLTGKVKTPSARQKVEKRKGRARGCGR